MKNDLGLVLTTEAKHAAISALLDRPFEFKEKPLIVQYEVTMQVCRFSFLYYFIFSTNNSLCIHFIYLLEAVVTKRLIV